MARPRQPLASAVLFGFADAKEERLYQQHITSVASTWRWFTRVVLISSAVSVLSSLRGWQQGAWRNQQWLVYQWALLAVWLACWASGMRPSPEGAVFLVRGRMPVFTLLAWLWNSLNGAQTTSAVKDTPCSWSRQIAWASAHTAIIVWGTPLAIRLNAVLQAGFTLFTAGVMFNAIGWKRPWDFTAGVATFSLLLLATICASDAYMRWQWSCTQRSEEAGRQQQHREQPQSSRHDGASDDDRPTSCNASEPCAPTPSALPPASSDEPSHTHTALTPAPQPSSLKVPLRALEAVRAAGMPLPPGATSRPRKGGNSPCSMQNYTSVFSNIERHVFKQPDAHPSDASRLFTAQGRAMALIAAQALVDSSPHLHPRPSFVNHIQARAA